MSRAYTADEMRGQFLDHLHDLVSHIDGLEKSSYEKLDQLAWAILNIFDGGDGALPAFELRPLPHEEDEAYRRGLDENFYPSGIDIADGPRHLHEMWVNRAHKGANK